jgi:PAS domain S-box-containing protein
VTVFENESPMVTRRERASSVAATVADDELLQTMFAEAPDGIVMADQEGRCVAVNARFCEIVGRSRSELMSMALADLVAPVETPRLASTRRRRLTHTGGIESGEWRVRAGGSEITVEANARTLANGRCLAVVRDVSTRRRAESSRDEVLRSVSHELRSPLQSIALTAQQLGEKLQLGLEPQVLRVSVDRILRASRSMARLVEDLLDVASIEAGRLGLRPVTLRPDTLVREAIDAFTAQAESQGIALTMAAVTATALVGDQGRLLQALSNLVGNALKFTPPGGTVLVCADDDDDGFVRISVVDSGPGLPREQVARAFEPFWQSRLADRRGRGLGLAIAKGIVEAHGGSIWLESEPGRGTIVRFTVPKATSGTPIT